MARRPHMADYEEESERFAEWFVSNKRGIITTRERFNQAYGDETGLVGVLSQNQKDFREKVFGKYEEKTGKLFEKAGGKDLERDRRTRAKVVTTDPDVYVRRGARRIDLQGLDTPSTVKGKVVLSRQEEISRRGKQVTIFRDRKGRFSSRK